MRCFSAVICSFSLSVSPVRSLYAQIFSLARVCVVVPSGCSSSILGQILLANAFALTLQVVKNEPCFSSIESHDEMQHVIDVMVG